MIIIVPVIVLLMIPLGTGLMKNIEYHISIKYIQFLVHYNISISVLSGQISEIALLCWDSLFGENEFFNFGSNIVEY